MTVKREEGKRVTFRIPDRLFETFEKLKGQMCKTYAEIVFDELMNYEKTIKILLYDNKLKNISLPGKRRSFFIYKKDDEKIKIMSKELMRTKDVIFFAIAVHFVMYREHSDNRWQKDNISTLQKKVKIADEYCSRLTYWMDARPEIPEELKSFPELQQYFSEDNILENVFGLEIVADNALMRFEEGLKCLQMRLKLAKAGREKT